MAPKPSASVSKITFSGGQECSFEPNEKVIIVGPNNSGKSQTLREIVNYASEGEKARPVVLTSLEIEKVGVQPNSKNILKNTPKLLTNTIVIKTGIFILILQGYGTSHFYKTIFLKDLSKTLMQTIG